MLTKITIGKYKTKEELMKAMRNGGNFVSPRAKELISSPDFTISSEEREVELVQVTPRDLGLRGAQNYDAICAAARAAGYDYCPAEVGPALRLAYTDQLVWEWITIGMEPIAGY